MSRCVVSSMVSALFFLLGCQAIVRTSVGNMQPIRVVVKWNNKCYRRGENLGCNCRICVVELKKGNACYLPKIIG